MEEKLVSEYIGKKAEKITEESHNWIAAILGPIMGPIWFFYRKSYLLGFMFLIITYVVNSITNAIELKGISVIMFLIYLFYANKLYLWDVRQKVNKIMSSWDKSEEELIFTIRKKVEQMV